MRGYINTVDSTKLDLRHVLFCGDVVNEYVSMLMRSLLGTFGRTFRLVETRSELQRALQMGVATTWNNCFTTRMVIHIPGPCKHTRTSETLSSYPLIHHFLHDVVSPLTDCSNPEMRSFSNLTHYLCLISIARATDQPRVASTGLTHNTVE